MKISQNHHGSFKPEENFPHGLTHRHRNRWTANSDEIWLNLRRACAGSKPDTLLPVF